MKKSATLDEVKKNETRYFLGGLAIWAATLAWGVWGPSALWAELLGAVACFGAAVCLFHSAALGGRAAGMRRRAGERALLFAAGYRLGQVELVSLGETRAARVEYDGDTVYEQDKGQG